ncbi:MAG TPA: heme o synthase [Candidatus Acidoferrales bacterium]|nr:heme o synthase [Candidatus Acidoferrales bacterium]
MNTLSRVDGSAVATKQQVEGWRGTLLDYYELGKPRIIYLLLITTAAAMVMAAHGMPSPELVFWTLLGGGLSAASAGAFNCVIDRDIDRVMRRTMLRPVVTGRISVRSALVAATLAGIAGVAILYAFAGWLAAVLSLAGNLYYVLVYTVWLKRRTPQNIVIGGAAGAVPPLVGWAAVTHQIGLPALGLFAIIFLWTPPHFWALSLITNADYDRAGIPMFANVYGVPRTKREIMLYTIVLVAVSLTLVDLHVMGAIYGICATILGAIFVYDAIKLTQDETRRWARSLFKFSLLYLALICAAMVIDRIFA